MNPVTRRLLDEIDDPQLAAFALAWDEFEECLVGIYRDRACSPRLERRYAELRSSAEQGLGMWEPTLRRHWLATRINGAPPQQSPFRTVVAVQRPGDVLDDRLLMRTLPAAREALNNLLLERGRPSDPPQAALDRS
jgi:hypothetical protein